jgi:hypothetical protein
MREHDRGVEIHCRWSVPYDRMATNTVVSQPPPALSRHAGTASRSPIRLAGSAGIAGLLLLSIALFLPGLPPRTDEPTRKILSFALAHRSELLVGAFLTPIALFGLLWMLAGVWRLLAGSDQDPLLLGGVLSGSLGLVLVVASVGLVAGLVLEAARGHDLVLVRFVTDSADIVTQIGLLLAGGFVLASSLAGRARGALPDWLVGLGLFATLVIAATSLPAMIVSGGPWQAGGFGALAGTGPLIAWFAVVAIRMARSG